jgi:hypothetical protein
MTPGIHFGVSREDYRKLPYMNQSTLKKWIELGAIPSEYKHWELNPPPPSEAQVVGDALDTLMLSLPEYNSKFYELDAKIDRRTKAGQEAWAAAKLEAGSRTILTLEQTLALGYMRDALLTSEATLGIFEHCKKAVLIGRLWDIDVKAEVDLWSEKSEFLMDLKSCKNVQEKSFKRDLVEYGYYYQATFYMLLARALGFEKQKFGFVCVRNSPPWTVCPYVFDPYNNDWHSALFQQAQRHLKDAAIELTRRRATDDFSNPATWKVIDIPTYIIEHKELQGAGLV